MFSAAKYTVFSIVLCINITQSSDRSGFFLWFYAWKKRGNVDRTFLRSINGYLLWGDSGILYSATSVDRVCERNVSESFLSGWYQASDDPDFRKRLRIEFSNLSASFPSKKKDPFRVLSVPYHDTGDGLYFSNYNRTLFYNTEDQQTPRNNWKKECSKICLIR